MAEASSNTKPVTAVIGAGVVGLHVAIALQERGHAVIVIDPGPPGGRQSASYGHGAWINPASFMPTSLPGLWKMVPGFLRDPLGPFYLSPFDLPRLASLLVRFLLAGRNWDKVEQCAIARYAICHGAVDTYKRLAAEAGRPELINQEGLFTVYRKRDSFLAATKEAAIRQRLGLSIREVSPEELHSREPDLAEGYTFATSIEEGAYMSDTAAYCRSVGELLVRKGGRVVAANAIGFSYDNGKLIAVNTDNGQFRCSHAVIAAGIHSAKLAALVGDRVPMGSERGYHVQIDGAPVGPRHSFILTDGRIAISRQAAGMRIAGQVELAPADKAPNWRRADILLHHAKRGLPGLNLDQNDLRIDRWMGHRPSTPDGLPVIGRSSRCAQVLHAFGHGHAGIAMAPATGRIIAALASGDAAEVDLAPYSAKRFRLFSRG